MAIFRAILTVSRTANIGVVVPRDAVELLRRRDATVGCFITLLLTVRRRPPLENVDLTFMRHAFGLVLERHVRARYVVAGRTQAA